MILKFIFYILYRLKGWGMEGVVPKEAQKCVMIASPHTSNWDIVFASAAFQEMKIPLKFTIKKEWFRFPFNLLIGPLGGIPIDRSPKVPGEKRLSMVDAMANIFQGRESIAVMVTPEGTRKRTEQWKTGFWYTAKQAGVPICLGYLDYKKKRAGVGMVIWPTDIEKDMATMMEFYDQITPCYPEKFSLDPRYTKHRKV
ncbi:MAG: 1-acyl-sn-glycerol-3-phosphate acyltransferase [Chitinophagales bacterium]|nr:1-acyl-sn-glycerol-3-phosphate acyltransferase [Chitinophagales bacterium]